MAFLKRALALFSTSKQYKRLKQNNSVKSRHILSAFLFEAQCVLKKSVIFVLSII